MRRITFFTLSVLAVAVVLLLTGWGTGTTRGKRGRGNRQAAGRSEYEDGRVLSKTREAYPEREVMVREGLPSDAQPEERTLPVGVRVACYVFFVAVVVEASAVLGAVIAVGMEYLGGWPDTWWL
jgi:hypothetical protein